MDPGSGGMESVMELPSYKGFHFCEEGFVCMQF